MLTLPYFTVLTICYYHSLSEVSIKKVFFKLLFHSNERKKESFLLFMLEIQELWREGPDVSWIEIVCACVVSGCVWHLKIGDNNV